MASLGIRSNLTDAIQNARQTQNAYYNALEANAEAQASGEPTRIALAAQLVDASFRAMNLANQVLAMIGNVGGTGAGSPRSATPTRRPQPSLPPSPASASQARQPQPPRYSTTNTTTGTTTTTTTATGTSARQGRGRASPLPPPPSQTQQGGTEEEVGGGGEAEGEESGGDGGETGEGNAATGRRRRSRTQGRIVGASRAMSVNLPYVNKQVQIGSRGGAYYINEKGNRIWLKENQKNQCVENSLPGAEGDCPSVIKSYRRKSSGAPSERVSTSVPSPSGGGGTSTTRLNSSASGIFRNSASAPAGAAPFIPPSGTVPPSFPPSTTSAAGGGIGINQQPPAQPQFQPQQPQAQFQSAYQPLIPPQQQQPQPSQPFFSQQTPYLQNPFPYALPPGQTWTTFLTGRQAGASAPLPSQTTTTTAPYAPLGASMRGSASVLNITPNPFAAPSFNQQLSGPSLPSSATATTGIGNYGGLFNAPASYGTQGTRSRTRGASTTTAAAAAAAAAAATLPPFTTPGFSLAAPSIPAFGTPGSGRTRRTPSRTPTRQAQAQTQPQFMQFQPQQQQQQQQQAVTGQPSQAQAFSSFLSSPPFQQQQEEERGEESPVSASPSSGIYGFNQPPNELWFSPAQTYPVSPPLFDYLPPEDQDPGLQLPSSFEAGAPNNEFSTTRFRQLAGIDLGPQPNELENEMINATLSGPNYLANFDLTGVPINLTPTPSPANPLTSGRNSVTPPSSAATATGNIASPPNQPAFGFPQSIGTPGVYEEGPFASENDPFDYIQSGFSPSGYNYGYAPPGASPQNDGASGRGTGRSRGRGRGRAGASNKSNGNNSNSARAGTGTNTPARGSSNGEGGSGDSSNSNNATNENENALAYAGNNPNNRAAISPSMLPFSTLYHQPLRSTLHDYGRATNETWNFDPFNGFSQASAP